MSDEVVVHKGRTTTIEVAFPFDVSGDTITSQIRTQPDQASSLIASWTVDFLTDGTDGIVTLKLEDTTTAGINEMSGYMDCKRVSGGEALAGWDKPLEVVFRGSVTD